MVLYKTPCHGEVVNVHLMQSPGINGGGFLRNEVPNITQSRNGVGGDTRSPHGSLVNGQLLKRDRYTQHKL